MIGDGFLDGVEFWIGLYRGYFEKEWFWIAEDSEAPAIWTQWNKGEPDNDGGSGYEDCGGTGNWDGHQMRWYDISCHERMFCLCQFPSQPHDDFALAKKRLGLFIVCFKFRFFQSWKTVKQLEI